jgi:hypothetical protein
VPVTVKAWAAGPPVMSISRSKVMVPDSGMASWPRASRLRVILMVLSATLASALH